MTLTISITQTVSPRGAFAGDVVTVTGVGFGVSQGRVVFDPLGVATLATIVSWQDDEVVFEVPGLQFENRIVKVLVERLDLLDSTNFPFWLRSTTPVSPALPLGLDYQWPNFEEGPDENEDDPRAFSAADFNRTLDRVAAISALPLLPPLVGAQPGGIPVLVEDPPGLIAWKVLAPSDLDPDPSTGGGAAVNVDVFTGSVLSGQTIFVLSQDPANLDEVKLYLNGVVHTRNTSFSLSGAGSRTLTWLIGGLQPMETDDSVEAHYEV